MIQLDNSNSDFIIVTMQGHLTHEDYQKFSPELDRHIKVGGQNCLLVDATQLNGWDLQAGWDDFKLGIKHRKDFSKIALVGNKKWEEYMAKFSGLIMAGEVQYFNEPERSKAENWLRG